MSETPETNAAEERCIKTGFKTGYIHVEFALKLERERNQWKQMYEEADWRTVEAEVLKQERDEARIQYRSTLALAEALANTQIELKKERDEQTAQMCQAVGYLSTIAEDCEAWLNSESDEPSVDFIKAVRDYAKKGISA